MEASELRLGNWVQIKCVSKDPLVVDIWDNQEFNEFNMKSLMFNDPDFEYKPIPLTEEWLLKFGFKKLSHYYFNDDNYFSLIDYKNKINYVLDDDRGDYMELKHVHQLQNLYFALTNTELTTHE